MSSARTDRRRRSAGFTVVEVLVAIVLTGILATIMFQLMQGQGRFAGLQNARQEVQQNARGALDLITSELRTIPGGAIASASATELEFRLPRAWGVLCDALPNGTVGVVFPRGLAPADLPSGNLTTEQRAAWGLAVSTGSGAYSTATITSTSTAAGNCAASLGISADSVDIRQLTITGFPLLATATPQTRVFVYQLVRYDAAEGTADQHWIRRRSGTGTPEPLAGPLLRNADGTLNGNALKFTYLCNNTPLTALQLAVGLNLRSINRVRVVVAMQSRNKVTQDSRSRQQEVDSMTVHLRNNPTPALACP